MGVSFLHLMVGFSAHRTAIYQQKLSAERIEVRLKILARRPQVKDKVNVVQKKEKRVSSKRKKRAAPSLISPPNIVKYLPPQYPRSARKWEQEGEVVIKFLIDEKGVPNILQIISSSGFSSLDQAAQVAVNSWRFRPAQKNGVQISYWMEQKIRFKLR